MPRRFGYIVNPAAASGRAAGRWHRLTRHLAARGLEGKVQWTSGPGSAGALAAELGQTHDVVVAVGGDGTAMEAASGLAAPGGPGAALALVPLGSGNDTARMLGAHDPATALATLEHGSIRNLDVIEVHCRDGAGGWVERLALDFAGAGFAADVLRLTPASWKPFAGARLAYAAGFFRALAGFRDVSLAVRCDDGWRVAGRMVAVLAANQARSGGGSMHTGPGARADDGRLEVSVIRSVGRCRMAGQFLGLLRGTHVHHPSVIYRPAREITLESETPVEIAADGDVLGTTPARFRVRPGALRVLAGAAASI
jgi:diacylglycerol kinase (ATP)